MPEPTGVEPATRSEGCGTEPTESSTLLANRSATEHPYLFNTSRCRFWIVFSQVLLVQFIGFFDSTILSSSHPVITSYFGSSSAASWLSTTFLIMSTAFQPLLGRLSDAVGRKPLFVGCIGVFTLATTWCTMAGSFWSFVIARAICGFGAGGAMALGQIITSDLVPLEQRGSYQACSNIIYGIGCPLGAAMGGVMAESIGWRWEFGVQVPLLLVSLGVSLMAIPGELGLRNQGLKRSIWATISMFDTGGSSLIAICITSLILALNLGGYILSWFHPFVLFCGSLFSVSLPAFLWVESRAASPIMPLQLLCSKPHANILYSNFIAAMLTYAILFNMPIYFQAVLLTSATSSGFYLILPSVIASATAAITGLTITRTRKPKWALYSGVLCYLIGTIPLWLLQRSAAPVFYVLVLVPSAMGQGFQFPGSLIAILAASAQSDQAVVTTTLLMWRSLGMVFGVALSSLVVQNSLAHYLGIFVSGDRRDDVISIARSSVAAIAGLDAPYREQVVDSYEAALHTMFFGCTLFSVLSLVVILPIKSVHISTRQDQPGDHGSEHGFRSR